MSFNLSRACLCGHRHYPGSCPKRICGCTVLRPDLKAAAGDETSAATGTAGRGE